MSSDITGQESEYSPLSQYRKNSFTMFYEANFYSIQFFLFWATFTAFFITLGYIVFALMDRFVAPILITLEEQYYPTTTKFRKGQDKETPNKNDLDIESKSLLHTKEDSVDRRDSDDEEQETPMIEPKTSPSLIQHMSNQQTIESPQFEFNEEKKCGLDDDVEKTLWKNINSEFMNQQKIDKINGNKNQQAPEESERYFDDTGFLVSRIQHVNQSYEDTVYLGSLETLGSGNLSLHDSSSSSQNSTTIKRLREDTKDYDWFNQSTVIKGEKDAHNNKPKKNDNRNNQIHKIQKPLTKTKEKEQVVQEIQKAVKWINLVVDNVKTKQEERKSFKPEERKSFKPEGRISEREKPVLPKEQEEALQGVCQFVFDKNSIPHQFGWKHYNIQQNTIDIRNAQGYLNIKTLHHQGLVKVTDSPISLRYKSCKVDGENAIFIGQEREEKPHGFVRLIYEDGAIFEGVVIKETILGWGRKISSTKCQIGQWRNQKLHSTSFEIQWDQGGKFISKKFGDFMNGLHVDDDGQDTVSIITAGSAFWEYKEEYFVKSAKYVKNNKYFPRIVTNYPLIVLKNYQSVSVSTMDIPKEIVSSMKEAYLEDEKFQKVFKMSKEDFYLLPEQTQIQAKKKIGLF